MIAKDQMRLDLILAPTEEPRDRKHVAVGKPCGASYQTFDRERERVISMKKALQLMRSCSVSFCALAIS